MVRDARLASFSEILGLLVQHEVPLAPAVRLAGDASGDAELSKSAGQLGNALASGIQLGTSTTAARSGELPRFLVWLIGAGETKQVLAPFLNQTAEMYRRSAIKRAEWIRFYLPLLMTLVIGGVAVLLYALALWVPLTNLLEEAATSNLMIQ
jgi:general secretion pathway protein F